MKTTFEFFIAITAILGIALTIGSYLLTKSKSEIENKDFSEKQNSPFININEKINSDKFLIEDHDKASKKIEQFKLRNRFYHS